MVAHNHGEHSNMKRILKELLLTKSKCQRIIDGQGQADRN